MPQEFYAPTPEEIRRECWEIQKTWSERKRRTCIADDRLRRQSTRVSVASTSCDAEREVAARKTW